MNFKAAIVEDDAKARESLSEMLSRYADEHGYGVRKRLYPDGYAFLNEYKGDYDVLFLDIEMPGMNGMQVAERVRASGDNVIIVFVTNMAQYAVESYSVRAFDFVLKPITYYGFLMKFDRVCKELDRRLNGAKILLSNRTQTRNVSVSDILYVEANNHDLVYRLYGESFRVRGTIAEAEKKLSEHHFVRCNSCYLVNLKHVESMKGDWIVVGGDELRMSRSRKAAFFAEFTRYAGGSV